MNYFSIQNIWLVLTIHGSLAYFHIPSYVEFQSPEASNSFGYSIGYLSSSNRLVVGDPLNGEDGKVYSCAITDIERKTSTCNNLDINMDKYAENYNRNNSIGQKFCLGASISVTQDYFLACAPLWSSYTLSSVFGALGTCFISNGTYVERYFGLTEKHYKRIRGTKLRQSFAVGNFFDTKTLYAVGMIRHTQSTGAIMFLYYDTTSQVLKIYLNDYYEPMLIEDSAVNSLYGVTLHGANLNFDNFTELLVGAPVQCNTVGGYEQGAVHIYIGEATNEGKENSNLCIYSTLDGSRFGTAVASIDLDGDGLSEIFISAPYEDTGVIYVLSGSEISTLLHKDRNSSVAVTSLKNIQRIVNSDIKAFGISLLSIADVNKNGLNALAIGSLNSNKLLLYKSMPVVNVTIYTILVGETVREQDKNFTVTVSVHVSYTTKQKIINGKLFVTINVDGVGVTIEKNKYEIVLKENITTFDIVVSFEDDEPGDYKFTATVEADKENLKRSDYDSSLYIINPHSRVRDAIDVQRRCNGTDCVPKLSVTIEWTGGNDQYVLGSSEKENMTLVVRNDGNATYQSCARVRIIGVQDIAYQTVVEPLQDKVKFISEFRGDNINFKIPDCVLEVDDWYRCDFIEIPRHSTYPVEIQLDMTKRTNRDENLKVNVTLFNNCASFGDASKKESKNITYILNTDDVHIEGINIDRNVTDSDINNEEIQNIDIHEVYVVINNGTVAWKSVRAVIELKKETYIKNYTVTTFGTKQCSEENIDVKLRIICILDLNPNSILKFLTTIKIIKTEIMDNFENGKLRVASNYTLYLEPTNEILKQSLTTTLSYQVDRGIGNNKNLIITLFVLIGLFVLLVIIIVLYQVQFFKRTEKDNALNALKEEIRKESIRRPAPKNDNFEEKDSAEEDDIEVIDYDILLQGENTQYRGDFVALIREEQL